MGIGGQLSNLWPIVQLVFLAGAGALVVGVLRRFTRPGPTKTRLTSLAILWGLAGATWIILRAWQWPLPDWIAPVRWVLSLSALGLVACWLWKIRTRPHRTSRTRSK